MNSGALVGGQIGAIVGGIAGQIGGIFGGKSLKKKEAQQRDIAAGLAWEQQLSACCNLADLTAELPRVPKRRRGRSVVPSPKPGRHRQ